VDRRSKFLESVKIKELDQESFTLNEICELKGVDKNQAQLLIESNLAMGTWEQVFKRGPTRIQKSYRLKEEIKHVEIKHVR
jgi:hypothetical protein